MVEYWQKAKGRHDLSSSYSSNFFDWKLVRSGVYVNCRWTRFDSMAWIENSFKRVHKYKRVCIDTHVHVSYKGWNFWMAVEKIFMESETATIHDESFSTRSRWKFNIGWESLMILSFEELDSMERIWPHHLGLARRRVLPHFLPRSFVDEFPRDKRLDTCVSF